MATLKRRTVAVRCYVPRKAVQRERPGEVDFNACSSQTGKEVEKLYSHTRVIQLHKDCLQHYTLGHRQKVKKENMSL